MRAKKRRLGTDCDIIRVSAWFKLAMPTFC